MIFINPKTDFALKILGSKESKAILISSHLLCDRFQENCL